MMSIDTGVQQNYRRTDPDGSRAAGESLESSGLGHTQRRDSLAAVKMYPGQTSKELAELTGLDRHMLGRRLPELLKAGQIWRHERGECRWYPIDSKKRLELANQMEDCRTAMLGYPEGHRERAEIQKQIDRLSKAMRA